MNISQAKFRLYNKSPFLGTIIFNLPVEESKEIPTLGVDGERLYYNKKFWNTLTNKEQVGVLAHEVGHLFLEHIYRRKHRDEIAVNPQTGQQVWLWNIAADYSTNLLVLDLLKSADFLPKGGLMDHKYRNWSTEKIYDDIKKGMKKMTKQQAQDLAKRTGDHSKWTKLKGKKKAEARGRMKQIGKQAAEAQKSSGKGDLPELLKRMFEELEPKEDWRKVLMEYIEPFINDYDFSRPDRRYLKEPYFLPDIQEGEKIDWIAIAIDTSGSISSKDLNEFISEVKGILGAYDKVKVKLTFCDADTTPFVELDEYEKDKIKPKGGGGTDFRPVFDLIKKEGSMPKALVYMTDLYGDFPSKAPDYDTIWVATETGQKAPFGLTLEYGK